MEPIKITDKLTLRQEALRLSVATGTNHPVSQAQQYEAYLLGDAELPEYEDTHKDFKEMLGKFQDSFKPNSWISADSEMKPAKGVKVFVRTKSGSYYSGEYDDGWYVSHKPVGDEIVAWMPIPPFTQPTL